PGVHYRVRVERYTLDALLHQPASQIRMIRRALTTDTDVLVGLTAGSNGIGQQLLDCSVTLVEQVSDNAGVPVQAQCQLSQVVGTDGETIEMLQELIGQQRVSR